MSPVVDQSMKLGVVTLVLVDIATFRKNDGRGMHSLQMRPLLVGHSLRGEAGAGTLQFGHYLEQLQKSLVRLDEYDDPLVRTFFDESER